MEVALQVSDFRKSLEPLCETGGDVNDEGVLADISSRPVLVIFKRSRQSGGVPEDWKKANITSPQSSKRARKRTREMQATQPQPNSWKYNGTAHSGAIFKHVENKKEISSAKHGFSREKSCLT